MADFSDLETAGPETCTATGAPPPRATVPAIATGLRMVRRGDGAQLEWDEATDPSTDHRNA